MVFACPRSHVNIIVTLHVQKVMIPVLVMPEMLLVDIQYAQIKGLMLCIHLSKPRTCMTRTIILDFVYYEFKYCVGQMHHKQTPLFTARGVVL